MFHLFKKKEKIKRELPPGTIRKEFHCKRQVICWIENHIKKIDNYIEN